MTHSIRLPKTKCNKYLAPSASRRVLARARQRVRDEPETVAQVVIAIVMDDDEERGDVTGASPIALLWWSATHGVVEV